MNKEASRAVTRRRFVEQTFAGILSYFGVWSALGQRDTKILVNEAARDFSHGPLIYEPNKIVASFLKADVYPLYSYYGNFFSFYLNSDKFKALTELEASCEKERANPEHEARLHRLVALPLVARIHTIPYLATLTERLALADQVSSALRQASSPMSGKAHREVIEITFQTLAALMAQTCTRERFYAGPELLKRAAEVCELFLGGEDALQYTALAAWQFLLGYEQAMSMAHTEEGTDELRRVRAIKMGILTRNDPKMWWLRRLMSIHDRWEQKFGEPLPQVQELFGLPMGQEKLEKEARSFLSVLRASMAGVFQSLADQQSGMTSAFMTSKNAERSAKIVYNLLRAEMGRNEQKRCLFELKNMVDTGLIDARIAKEFQAKVVEGEILPLNVNPLVGFLPLSRIEPARVGGTVLSLRRGTEWNTRDEIRSDLKEGSLDAARSIGVKGLDEETIREKADTLLDKYPRALERFCEESRMLEPERRRADKFSSPSGTPGLEGVTIAKPKIGDLKPTQERRKRQRTPEQIEEQNKLNAKARTLLEELLSKDEWDRKGLAKEIGVTASYIGGVITCVAGVAPWFVKSLERIQSGSPSSSDTTGRAVVREIRKFPVEDRPEIEEVTIAFLKALATKKTCYTS